MYAALACGNYRHAPIRRQKKLKRKASLSANIFTEGDACFSAVLPQTARQNYKGLFLVTTKLLDIDSVFHGKTLGNAGLVELLTATEFFGNAGLFELSLKLLESALNVFALFDGYYDHSFV